MIIVRSAQATDFDAVLALARQAGPGLTTLKPDAQMLEQRLQRVERTLADVEPWAQQGYLFVLEDLDASRVIGVSGIETAVGLSEPFYNYRLGTLVHASRELNVWRRMRVLTISNDLTGSAELCSLFLDPAYRRQGLAPLLSKARFLFIAEFPQRFPERLCAEMRGHFDEAGESPFWNALGARFYQIDFNEADYRSSLGKKSFVAELMPRYPVYVELLSDEAQACLGATHRETRAARTLLEGEGMRFEHHIDIFDAGPVLEVHRDATRAARDSVSVTVSVLPAGLEPHRPLGEQNQVRRQAEIDDASTAAALAARFDADEAPHLIACGSPSRFRAALLPHGASGVLGDTVVLTASQAEALQVHNGASARLLPLDAWAPR